MKKDKLFDLGNGNSQIRLSLQWVYSKTKLLEDILERLWDEMTQLEDARILASSDLETMREPFRFILSQLEGSQSRPSSMGSGRGSPKQPSRSRAKTGDVNFEFLEQAVAKKVEVRQQEEVFSRNVDNMIS